MMFNQGLANYVPYESFTYPELLYIVALKHSQ